MKLGMKDLARMFGVEERTIEGWIKQEDLPHQRVQGQFRFHRAEVLEWANAHGVPITGDAPISVHPARPTPTLVDSLAAGGIHYDVEGADRDAVVRAIVERLPSVEDFDRELLVDVLIARETAGSTGIGDGIAIPHVRSPLVASIERPLVVLCFLRTPVDFGAIDRKPVHTVFTFVTPTIRGHLHLLARLATALHDRDFRKALEARASAEELLSTLAAAERGFVPPDLPDGPDEDDADGESPP